MERSGQTVSAVRDSAELCDLLQLRKPVATIWANRPDHMPNAIASYSRDLGRAVAERVATDVADVTESTLTEVLRDAPSAVLVVSDTGIEFVEGGIEPLRHERILFGPLPALAPVIEHRQADIPFVVVMMDRRGADFYWTTPKREGRRTVNGDQTHLTKVQAGGWSNRTYQQRAENTWEHTAVDVAEQLQALVHEIDARVVIVASEERMEQLLRKHLPNEVGDLLRDVSATRAKDGSEQDRQAQIERWVRTAVAEDTVAALQLFDQERGQLDRAANGATATFEALRESRVDTLLIHDGGTEDTTAFYDDDDAGMVALDRTLLEDLGRHPTGPARLQDVAIRACLLTGAGIRIVPAHSSLDEHIGAILRW